MNDSCFDELVGTLEKGGPDAVFDRLACQLRESGKYHELFDARLMQSRHRLGLPVVESRSLEELPEPLREQMEDAYLAACREVGLLFLQAGNVPEAWMYLRPVGDRASVREALERLTPSDESLDDLVAISVHEGVHPSWGFRLVLDRYGTCNAISRYDAAMHARPRHEQQAVAGLLVGRVHSELRANIVSDVTRQSGSVPPENSIEALVVDRDWLFTDNNYHIDTSHLSAVVRFARVVDDPAVLRQAVDLCEYGARLSSSFQYAGEEPFADLYPASGLYFRALLGERTAEAIDYFRGRADAASSDDRGSLPTEVYVFLLDRLGRTEEAIAEASRSLKRGARTPGFAPSLHTMARRSGKYGALKELCRQRGDALGFTAAGVEEWLAIRPSKESP